MATEKTEVRSIRAKKSVWKELDRLAEIDDRKLNAYIRRLFELHLMKNKVQATKP